MGMEVAHDALAVHVMIAVILDVGALTHFGDLIIGVDI